MRRYFLLLLFSFLLCFPASAAPAASSANAAVASGSNAENSGYFLTDSQPNLVQDDGSNGISLYSSLGTIVNTIDYSGASVVLRYKTTSGSFVDLGTMIHEDGSFTFTKPNNYKSGSAVYIKLSSRSLPPPGTYDIVVDFSSNTGQTYRGVYFSMDKEQDNVSSPAFSVSSSDFDFAQSSGDFQIRTSMQMGNLKSLSLGASISDVGFPFGGVIRVSFQMTDEEPAIKLPGSDPEKVAQEADQAIQNNTGDIADNTGLLVEGQQDIVDGIAEIVQTISNQLEAFWLQLAHEFTNLYNKMNQHHQEDLDAIQTQTDDLTDNLDKNTNTIINGYDNSGLTEQDQILSDSLTEYESAQDEVLDTAKDYVDTFEFENPFTQFAAPLASVSYLLSGIYTTLGTFNIPIGFSLTLTIALLCIGWYRFRGGG